MMLEPVPVTFSLDALTHAEFVFVNQESSVKKGCGWNYFIVSCYINSYCSSLSIAAMEQRLSFFFFSAYLIMLPLLQALDLQRDMSDFPSTVVSTDLYPTVL